MFKNDKSNTVGRKNLINREVWLKKTLEKLPRGSTILDAGAGETQYKKFCQHLKYTSQDFGEYDGQGDEVGLQTKEWDNSKLDIVSDIINIPVEDNSFDNIMCIEVFEHLIEPYKAITEFSRILKLGGYLVLTAPICSLTHFAPHYYANGFSKYWYRKVLEDHGFEIKELEYNGNYFEYVAQEIRRIPSVQNKYTKKRLTNNLKYKFSRNHILKVLDELSKNNQNSEELLAFGIQVVAKKIK
ncbi:MAG: methyltransferase domain-containing protein [bacterium]